MHWENVLVCPPISPSIRPSYKFNCWWSVQATDNLRYSMSLHFFLSNKNEYTLYLMYFSCYTAQHSTDFLWPWPWGQIRRHISTSSGSSLPCLHFPIVLSQCHPAVKPFRSEEDEWSGLRSVWGWHGCTERVLAPLTGVFLLWRGHQGFGGICCSPWQQCDGALTMEAADQGLVQGALGGFFLRHGSWVRKECSYGRLFRIQAKSIPVFVTGFKSFFLLKRKGDY